MKKKFLLQIWCLIKYWNKQKDLIPQKKLEGLAHSILVILDGENAHLPPFNVSPTTGYVNIAGTLHNDFYKNKPEKGGK